MEKIEHAKVEDAPAILALQKLAYQSEAALVNDYTIQPLTQTVEELEEEFERATILTYTEDEGIIGSVRALIENETCHISKLMVHPTHQDKGIGKKLMMAIEEIASAPRYELFTGSVSVKNIAFYEKMGYKIYKTEKLPREETIFVFMEKRANRY